MNNVQAQVYQYNGKWRIDLDLPRWIVDEITNLSYQGAALRISGSSIMGGSGPHSEAHLYLAQEIPEASKEPRVEE